MSWDDLKTDTIETDARCEWVPKGVPFALLQLSGDFDVVPDYVDKLPDGTPGPPSGTTGTGAIARGSGQGGLYYKDFLSNDILTCPYTYPPPVRPELEDASFTWQNNWCWKGQVLKRPYYRYPERHSISYLRQALLIHLSMSFSVTWPLQPLGDCLCGASSGVLIPAGGSGSTGLTAGPCTPEGDLCFCTDCSNEAGNYSATASIAWTSSYNESWIFEPDFRTFDDITYWHSAISKVWHIGEIIARSVTMIGPAGSSSDSHAAQIAPQNCYCLGNPFAAAHGGGAVLQTQIVDLVPNWQDGIIEDGEGNEYFDGYKIEWPSDDEFPGPGA